MPISSVTGYPGSHWDDVLSIIESSIASAGFKPNLVSYADETSVIHKTIVQNLYDNPVVVCDVSAKNPNVMFELGLRLAFDKPTIVIKDEKTAYSFDTGVIEHLPYPSDLRFQPIVDFQAKLAEKIKATYNRASTDPDYSVFLNHFGTFKLPKLKEEEVSIQQYLFEELRLLRNEMGAIARTVSPAPEKPEELGPRILHLGFSKDLSSEQVVSAIRNFPGVLNVVATEAEGFKVAEVTLGPRSGSLTARKISDFLKLLAKEQSRKNDPSG